MTVEELPDLSDPEANAAAIKIQAVQKGRKTRAEIAQLKDPEAERAYAGPQAQTNEEMPDLSDPDVNAAATKIQAVQKGRAARAEVAQMKAHNGEGGEGSRGTGSVVEEQEGMPDLTDPDVNAAATKIQAVQKGRRARADVADMRASREEEGGQEDKEAEVDEGSAIVLHSEAPKPELAKGMDAKEVAEMFFLAVENRDYDTWLHCLHMESRSHPSSREPGPFWCQSWEALRDSVRKHSANYRLESETPNVSQKYVTLRYAPLYGDVPGYNIGDRLSTKNVVLEMERDETEWRVYRISYEES